MAVVNIKGVIVTNSDQWVYDLFDMEATSPAKVKKEIEAAKGEDLEVFINSPGGEVFSGSEIYTDLKSYKGHVTVKIVGVAASAASVIAMAGDKVLITPTGQLMMHNVTTVAKGDYRSMEHTAGALKNANATIANAYRIKTGLSQEQLLKLMDEETWFTPEQAKKYGLVDGVLFELNPKEQAQARLKLLKKLDPTGTL